MLAAECRPALADRAVQILGTDIAREPLARARAGLYTRFEVQRGLPARLLNKYFREEDAGDPVVARYGHVLQAAICPALSMFAKH